MRIISNYATLLRVPNLIIVILTEWLLYRYVLLPAYDLADISPSLNATQILILALITALITAGGYIINDIADHKIDLINRPQKVIIRKKISIEVAYLLYFVISIFGFILSFYLGLKTGNIHLLFLYPIAVMGLFLYSVSFKKLALIDNLVVSFFCAGVAGIIAVAERKSIAKLIG